MKNFSRSFFQPYPLLLHFYVSYGFFYGLLLLLQMSQLLNPQLSESEKSELKESFHQMLKWAWRYNKNLEEQAAQLHMLTGWSQIVEVSLLFVCLLSFS